MPSNKKALGRHPQGSKLTSRTRNFTTTIRPGSFSWRKQKQALTISDQVFIFRSKRSPRGCYKTPLPEDLF